MQSSPLNEGTVSNRSGIDCAPHLTWLSSPAAIFGLISAYLLGHFCLRLLLSPTLGIDDAEQTLFAQHWAFGYRFRQPPLFTWMLMVVVELIGPGILAISLVRYALLMATYVFIYLTARLCLQDQRMAGLAVLSFAMIYVFAYYAHHDLTHTTALSAMIALAFYITAKLAQAPTWMAYAGVGLVFALGVLAKWNFAMLAVGLPLTCLVLPQLRHLVLTPKMLAALGIMAVLLAPTALWMVAQGQSIQGVAGSILVPIDDGSDMVSVTAAGLDLLTAVLLFPLPFLPIFLLLFGKSFYAGLAFKSSPGMDQTNSPLPPAFFGWLTLIVLGLHVLLIPIFGAIDFTERWLHPALMGLPIFLFALAERGSPSPRSIVAFLVLLAILVAVASGARLYRFAAGADDCGRCREFAPFAELADGLRKAGFSSGTIIADGMHIGGNLRMHFAGSRVIDPAFPKALWPEAGSSDGSGTCLLVWRDDDRDAAAKRTVLKRFAVQQLDLAPMSRPDRGRLEAPLLESSSRRYALGYEIYRENIGGCR